MTNAIAERWLNGTVAGQGRESTGGAPNASGNSAARGGGAVHVDRRAETGLDRRGSGHGMLEASRVASRWSVARRHIIMKFLSKLPGTRFKSRLVRALLGVRMGSNVGLAYGVMLDPYDPSLISFGDNVIVGYDTKIFVHAFTLNRQRVRPVRIGSNVLIGGFCVIAPGVSIGDGATIAPGTIVTRNVPAGALATGNTMRIRKRDMATDGSRSTIDD